MAPGESIQDWIKRVAPAAIEVPPWSPPPTFDYDLDDSRLLGALPLQDAVRFSKNKLAVGHLPHTVVSLDYFRHDVGVAVAFTNGVSVWFQAPRHRERYDGNIWDDCFFVWDTMPEETREFLECLHWSPMKPMGPMEVLANAAE